MAELGVLVLTNDVTSARGVPSRIAASAGEKEEAITIVLY